MVKAMTLQMFIAITSSGAGLPTSLEPGRMTSPTCEMAVFIFDRTTRRKSGNGLTGPSRVTGALGLLSLKAKAISACVARSCTNEILTAPKRFKSYFHVFWMLVNILLCESETASEQVGKYV